jgi:hypothetical protein
MEGVMTLTGNFFSGIYTWVRNVFPVWSHNIIILFSLIFLVVIYSVIIWKGYRFLSKKNLLNLNLTKYNNYQHPFFERVFEGLLYFLEYIVISPFVIFGAFVMLTLMLIFLNEGLSIAGILLVSAIIIASIRATSYYNEDLSKELAKMFPFLVLAVSFLNPKFFDLERIIFTFQELPSLLSQVGIYLLFIVLFEVMLRFFYFLFSFFGLEEIEVQELPKEQ